MHIDLEDRHGSERKTVVWIPYAVLTTISAITLMGFAYLHSAGWGITIDLKKFADAFIVTAKPAEGMGNPPTQAAAAPIAPIANTQPSTIAQQQSRMRPLNWNVHLAKFNEIFIRHPACDPHNMKWTQMDCSNFRARAMKRFGTEWNKDAYWNGSNIIKNKAADARVNSELPL